MSAPPRCTIAIPVYARGDCRLNRLAIESALEHAPPDAELLVIDDASPGDVWAVLQSYRDPRLRLVRNERNLGLFGNFNRCLELAAAPFVRILCTDDQLVADAVEVELALMERHPSAALVSTQGVRVGATGAVLGPQADHLEPGLYDGRDAIAGVLWFKAHYGLNPLNYPSGVLLRRSAILKAGGFDTQMRMAGDVDLFLRLLRHGDLVVTRSVGCLIAVHEEQEGTKLSRDARVVHEDFLMVERNADVLHAAGVYDATRRQFGGVALGLAQRCARAGDWSSARALLASGPSHGVSVPAMGVGLARLVGLRAMLRLRGVRRTFARPSRAA